MEPLARLLAAERIGLVGDVHGDFGAMQAACGWFKRKGVDVILQAGDFGFIWYRDYPRHMRKLDRVLALHDQVMLWADGNHENFEALNTIPLDEHGLRPTSERTAHMPRGWRTTLAHGRTFTAFGGAASIDRAFRSEGTSWWSGELITDDDIDALGSEPTDIILGHDAPRGLSSLDLQLASNAWRWTQSGLAYADWGRSLYQRGFTAVRPRLSFSGHYHASHQGIVRTETETEPFETRAFILNCAGLNGGQLVLDLETLRVT